jgi:hypothetical protein
MSVKSSRRRTERRRKPRADARLSMRVEGVQDGQSAQIVTESQNISASGVYCTSSHYLAPLSKVALTIVLPKLPGTRGAQDLVKCDGIVVRCEPTARRADRKFELACMFSGLDERRRALIDDFVTWRNLQALAGAVNGRRPARAATSKAKPRTHARAAKPASGAKASAAKKKTTARRAASASGR